MLMEVFWIGLSIGIGISAAVIPVAAAFLLINFVSNRVDTE